MVNPLTRRNERYLTQPYERSGIRARDKQLTFPPEGQEEPMREPDHVPRQLLLALTLLDRRDVRWR